MNAKNTGSQSLRPKARIIHTLGDELISSDTVAVIELVKNSFDADATRVLILFSEPFELGKGKIEIIDNGSGMSLEEIQTTWMEPATAFRKQNKYSENKKRRVLGEKGIGRFASARLTDNLEIISRLKDSDEEVKAFFNWKEFDDESRYLDEIKINWEISNPQEICQDSSIQSVYWEIDEVSPSVPDHGTILRMEHLKTKWDEDKFEKLAKDLSRLILPPFYNEMESINDDFQIMLELPDPFNQFSGLIGPPETLKHPKYSLKGNIDKDGKYSFDLTIHETEFSYKLSDQFFDNGKKPSCGPIYLDFRVWDRDPRSLQPLVDKLDKKIKEIRNDLDKSAGISVFRDGFRVLPYGEPGDDWLKLDKRRVQVPTLRLSNNQIVGSIKLSADENPELKDQSNREGIRDCQEFDDLKNIIEESLNLLEVQRYEYRHICVNTKETGLFTDFDLTSLKNEIKDRYPNDKSLFRILDEKENNLNEKTKEYRVILSRYQRLATMGRIVDIILHDGITPLSNIRSVTVLGIRELSKNKTLGTELLENVKGRFDEIQKNADILSNLFRRIQPFGGRKRGRPGQVCLETVISDGFEILESEIVNTGAKVTLPSTSHLVTVDVAEIQIVILNLLDNSLYWLKKVPIKERNIEVQVERKNENEINILFSDTGPGIEEKDHDFIFNSDFSRKNRGTGLGLYIANEIIQDYYDGSLKLVEESETRGTKFLITLKRRV